MSRPSLSSFWRTSASSSSPSVTISEGLTSLRIESSLEGMTPSDLNPMSSSTSSESIFTTVPVTRPPSSNSTRVASMASESDMPPRSSSTTSMISPISSNSGLVSISGSGVVGSSTTAVVACSVSDKG